VINPLIFYDRVLHMRKAQKAYLAARSHDELVAARQAEREVDEMLAELEPPKEQKGSSK